jgi:hypothetical protein
MLHRNKCMVRPACWWVKKSASASTPFGKKAKGVWAPLQTPIEVRGDPQAPANGYLADVEMANGSQLTLVTSPAQFDERPRGPRGHPNRASTPRRCCSILASRGTTSRNSRNALSSDKRSRHIVRARRWHLLGLGHERWALQPSEQSATIAHLG